MSNVDLVTREEVVQQLCSLSRARVSGNHFEFGGNRWELVSREFKKTGRHVLENVFLSPLSRSPLSRSKSSKSSCL